MSFQSTSSCNISTVNVLLKCDLAMHKRERESERERGVFESKRKLGIEISSPSRCWSMTPRIVDILEKKLFGSV